MDTREYIESGTLDLYVAGLLSVEEMRDVELKACQYPEVKTELQTLQASLEKFAMKHAMPPPAALKERIMKRIGNGTEETGNREQVTTKVRDISSAKTPMATYFAAASIALMIIAGVVAYRYAMQVRDYRQQVAQLNSEQSALKNEMSALQDNMSQNQQHMAMLSDPNTMRIAMKGTDKSPGSMAMIYWNKQDKSVYLDIKSLPMNPSDKQYQLWFIDPSNKPVSAGVFDANAVEWMKMVDAPDALAFAVTLEPRGGSVNPTMEEMYVIGMVSS